MGQIIAGFDQGGLRSQLKRHATPGRTADTTLRTELEMSVQLWTILLADWHWMQGIAERRSWKVEPLSIAPPASDADIHRAETAAGLPMPQQLRQLLTHYSASIRFGWHVPSHLQPMEALGLPTGSFNRGFAWDLEQIIAHAIPNFISLRDVSVGIDETEAPNPPEMWEHQFPVFWLSNGDILTIDMRDPDGAQPVRYFSHDFEGLHGQALAPDFLGFVSQMAALGQAGSEWASWMGFGEWDEDHFYLHSDSKGGRAWRAWLESDPSLSLPDEPPPVVLGETAADRDLLIATRDGDVAAFEAALVVGGRLDAVWNRAWREEAPAGADEFATPLTFCVARNDLAMAERLLAQGATLDTRRLPLAEAVTRSSLNTVHWLLKRGARVNGWKHDRHWPLHLLITRRSEVVAETDEELDTKLRTSNNLWDDGSETSAIMRKVFERGRRRKLAARLSKADYLEMLEALLAAGADPDALWDNGITMLFCADPDTARILIHHGADPHRRSPDGQTALHYTRWPEVARLLVDAGADINDVASPGGRNSETGRVYTPLQSSFILAGLRGTELPRTILELGADPYKRDGDGISALGYATSVSAFELLRPYGLDPRERMPDGGTLLHRLMLQQGPTRATFPDEVEMLDLLLSEGIDINAQDHAGRTVLHLTAPIVMDVASIELLLTRGADPGVKDTNGKRAIDLIPQSRKELRDALRLAGRDTGRARE